MKKKKKLKLKLIFEYYKLLNIFYLHRKIELIVY